MVALLRGQGAVIEPIYCSAPTLNSPRLGHEGGSGVVAAAAAAVVSIAGVALSRAVCVDALFAVRALVHADHHAGVHDADQEVSHAIRALL